MKKKYDPEALLNSYRNGTCTPEESALVESWHLQDLRSRNFEPNLEEIEAARDKMWQQIRSETVTLKRLHHQWLYYAASVVVVLGCGLLFWRSAVNHPAVKANYTSVKPKPIAPGGNKAVLTLGNSKQVVLDQAAAGLIANEGQSAVLKNRDGLIQYKSGHKDMPVVYNMISIPRGGMYGMILEDGTRVWLNSSSTMRYPTVFSGATRQVEVTGEAYFEVAKNKTMPFIVAMSDQKIQVVGTHFNVHAYQDEKKSETTLLEGKILITKGMQTEVLKRGQQAVNIAGNTRIQVKYIPDSEDVIAWKNGYFSSSHESIYSVMNKIARWYDVEIEYRGNFDGKVFGGTISKFKSVKEVLNIIELTGSVHFKINERRIIVMP